MLVHDKATPQDASTASGIPLEELREVFKRERARIKEVVVGAVLKFEEEALGPQVAAEL